jgi:hypothetical protein
MKCAARIVPIDDIRPSGVRQSPTRIFGSTGSRPSDTEYVLRNCPWENADRQCAPFSTTNRST